MHWLAFFGFASLYLFLIVGFFLKIMGGLWSSWGVTMAAVAAGILSLAVRGMVIRRSQGRPILNIELFWSLTSFALFMATTLVVWATQITPDHVVYEQSLMVSAPVEKIWPLVSDPSERPRWDSYLEKVTKISEDTYRFEINATGTKVSGDQKIVEKLENKKISLQIFEPQGPGEKHAVQNLITSFELEPQSQGTLLKMATRFEVKDLIAKMMSTIVAKKFMNDSMVKYLGAIKDISEGRIERVKSEAVHLELRQPGQGANLDSK